MQTFIYTASALAGAYLILLAFLMNTENFRSTLLFKFIPMMLGLAALVSAGKSSGFL